MNIWSKVVEKKQAEIYVLQLFWPNDSPIPYSSPKELLSTTFTINPSESYYHLIQYKLKFTQCFRTLPQELLIIHVIKYGLF
jgi:hypothetical protein